MALTPSTMIELGQQAPDFSLIDVVSQQTVKRDELMGDNGLLVVFTCNHCPYVKHIHFQLVQVCNEYKEKGLGIAFISANDVENYPDDSPEKMKALAEESGYQFPYLYDESQETAKAYDAACTPDFFLFNAEASCVYRGRFDESSPGKDAPVTGADLKAAMENLVHGKPISQDQKPSVGCNIKWKKK